MAKNQISADVEFQGLISQTPGQGANNSSPFAQYGDLFSDALLSGGVLTVPSPASLVATLPLGTAAVLGQRVPFPATPFTVGASATSYLDLSNTGEVAVSTSGTVTANSLRLWEVISAAILSPAPSLAPSTAAGTLALGTYDYELVAHDATGYGLPGTAVSVALALTAPTPTLAASTAAGTLVAGTYTYGLVAYTATGYSLLGTTTAITTTATGEVVLTWVFPPNVTSVDVYGNIAGSLGLMASGITATTWTDDGSVTPGAAAPTVATATGEVVLTWTNPLNETSMDIYGRISGSIGLLASGVTGTTWTDTGAATVGAAPPTAATSNAIQSVTPIALQGSPYIKFRAWRQSPLTTAAGGFNTIPLDTVSYNTGPASLLGSDGKIHVSVAGYYSVCGVFMMATTQSTNVTVATVLAKNDSNNGEAIYGDQVNIIGTLYTPASSVSGLMYLTPADTLSLLVYTQIALPIYSMSSANFISIVGPF